MVWETPKTDWHYSIDSDGKYTGDYFNASDYNRIKNNLAYLHEYAQALYESFAIETVSEDKSYADFFYADEINKIEQNLETINTNTVNGSYGTTKFYTANGNTPDYNELNRIESACLDLYNKLHNQFDGRRIFTWNFGMKGGL